VVIVHGSAGVDVRGGSYAELLNEAGIATLEIDMWAARGTMRGVKGRPKAVPETLGDAFGALQFLARQPEIDPERIGLMGFSWGGVVTMLSATNSYAAPYAAKGLSFKAEAAFYPVCWIYNHLDGYGFRDLTPAKLLLLAGDKDVYDESPQPCQDLVAGLSDKERGQVRLISYPDAGHGFDRPGEPMVGLDPMSHRGKGGMVNLTFEPNASKAAHAEIVRFFLEQLGIAAKR
jgi:dienelactone hydrolase